LIVFLFFSPFLLVLLFLLPFPPLAPSLDFFLWVTPVLGHQLLMVNSSSADSGLWQKSCLSMSMMPGAAQHGCAGFQDLFEVGEQVMPKPGIFGQTFTAD
jgi:hypothetical protein